jgi:hypothetical protein
LQPNERENMTGWDVAERVWNEQSIWSQAASRMKRRIEHTRLAALLITVAVAVFGTTASAVGVDNIPGRILAAAAGLGAASLPVLQRFWAGNALKHWVGLRSVSEGLKSDIYLWLAGAGAFAVDDASGAVLQDRADKIAQDASHLIRFRDGVEPVRRPLPPVHNGASFFQIRVASQIDGYYRPRAVLLERRLKKFRRGQILLAAVTAVLGFVAALAKSDLGIWIGVATTIGTAIALHVAATRYEYQLLEFQRTAARLTALLNKAERAPDPGERLRLAAIAESAISVENQAWMVKIAEDTATTD